MTILNLGFQLAAIGVAHTEISFAQVENFGTIESVRCTFEESVTTSLKSGSNCHTFWYLNLQGGAGGGDT